MGGLPFWLLQKNPDVKLRTNDPKFMIYVEKWLKVLYGKLSKFLIENGGPIIMVQIENEYGSYVQVKKRLSWATREKNLLLSHWLEMLIRTTKVTINRYKILL